MPIWQSTHLHPALTGQSGNGSVGLMDNSASPPSLDYTITADDYINALRLRMRRYWLCNKRVKLFVAAVIVACVLAFTLSGLHSIAGSLAGGAIIGLVGIGVWLLLGYVFFLPRQARKIYAQQKSMQYPVRASWDSEAFSAATEIATNSTPWTDYHGWSADEKIILLMHSLLLFQMVPRRALSPEQESDLTAELEGNGLRRI